MTTRIIIIIIIQQKFMIRTFIELYQSIKC
jgi:hypothetical protein